MPKVSGFMPWCKKAIEAPTGKHPSSTIGTHRPPGNPGCLLPGWHIQGRASPHFPQEPGGAVCWGTGKVISPEGHSQVYQLGNPIPDQEDFNNTDQVSMKYQTWLQLGSLHDEMYHNTITLQNPIFTLNTEWWDIHYFLVIILFFA